MQFVWLSDPTTAQRMYMFVCVYCPLVYHRFPTLLGRNNLFIAQDLGCEGMLNHKATAACQGAVESEHQKQGAPEPSGTWKASIPRPTAASEQDRGGLKGGGSNRAGNIWPSHPKDQAFVRCLLF